MVPEFTVFSEILTVFWWKPDFINPLYMCLCVFSLFQVTVMQTAWFSTSCSSRPSLASSASFLWTGTPAGGSGSGWRPTDVLTVSLIKSWLYWVTVQLKSLWTPAPAEFVYLSSREIWILKMQERDKQLRLQRELTPRQTIACFNLVQKENTQQHHTGLLFLFFPFVIIHRYKEQTNPPCQSYLGSFSFLTTDLHSHLCC